MCGQESIKPDHGPVQVITRNLDEIPEGATAPTGAAFLRGWDRFSLRHLLLWMIGIALATGYFRGLGAVRLAMADTVQRSQGVFLFDFFSAWLIGTLDVHDLTLAIAAGSILGLGTPAILTGPANSSFFEHPARILFSVCLALIGTAIASDLIWLVGDCSFFRPDPVTCSMVAAAIGFAWSLYALLKSRVGWAWRVAVLLICISYASSFCLDGQLASVFLPTSSLNAGRRYASYVFYTPYSVENFKVSGVAETLLGCGIAFAVLVAGIIEITVGRFKDWRTWTATLVIPICIVLIATPWIYEMVRSYRLDQMSGV